MHSDEDRQGRDTSPEAAPRASSARIYDHFLGGTHNFPEDRRVARAIERSFPAVRSGIRLNRDYLQRAVRYLSDLGIDQFLDLGSGIPTVGNVHEIAQQMNPDSRVVYVDLDPIAIAHSVAILQSNSNAVAIEADVRDVDSILRNGEVCALLDFSRPIAILMVALLHFIPDSDDPTSIIGHYRDAVPSGSFLALSHAGLISDIPPEMTPGAEELLTEIRDNTSTPISTRGHAEVLRLFGGWELLPPGLVQIYDWRRDTGAPTPDITGSVSIFGGVGRKY